MRSHLALLNILSVRAGAVSDVFMAYMLGTPRHGLESVATSIAQKALKAAKAEPTQRDILQLYSSLEAAASENVLLKMASEIIILIKGSCTKGNGRFYKSRTKM